MLFPCIRLSVLNDAAFPSLNPCQHLISHNFHQTGYHWQLESDCMTPCRPSFFLNIWIFVESWMGIRSPVHTHPMLYSAMCWFLSWDSHSFKSTDSAAIFIRFWMCFMCEGIMRENYIIHDSGNRFSEPWSIAKISKIPTKSFNFPSSIVNRTNL